MHAGDYLDVFRAKGVAGVVRLNKKDVPGTPNEFAISIDTSTSASFNGVTPGTELRRA